jgi:hypothetical protein
MKRIKATDNGSAERVVQMNEANSNRVNEQREQLALDKGKRSTLHRSRSLTNRTFFAEQLTLN